MVGKVDHIGEDCGCNIHSAEADTLIRDLAIISADAAGDAIGAHDSIDNVLLPARAETGQSGRSGRVPLVRGVDEHYRHLLGSERGNGIEVLGSAGRSASP